MPQNFRYVAYGLQIESEIELPELGAERNDAAEADLTIRLGEVARFGTEGGGMQDKSRWINPKRFWLHADNVAHYLACDGRNITVMIEPGADPRAVRLYLLGSVSGAMLLQRGRLVLHGNAIRIGDGCLVCVGDSGAGKSTLAAGFLQRQFEVIADDVVPVDEQGNAVSGFPRIKLWQDTANQLDISTEELAPIILGMEKYNLPLSDHDPYLRLPIRWVYLLTKDDVEGISIEPISGIDRFRSLRENTYCGEYLYRPEMLTRHLQQCSQLASQIYMAKVTRPSKGFALDGLIDRLLGDVATAGSRL